MANVESPSLTILGCGYIGTAVARRALQRGWQVSALTRNAEAAAGLRELGLQRVVEAEIDSDSWHGELDAEQDYVLNCVSSGGNGLEGYRKSYVNGQRSLVQWAGRGRLGTVVYTSATSVYPQSEGEWVDEDTPTQGCSPTGELLLESERVLAEAVAGIGRWFVLRLGGIYGPQRHFMLDRIRGGDTHFSGSPEGYINLIRQEDVVSAVEASFAAPEGLANRIYNVIDGSPVTREAFYGWLAEQCGQGEVSFDPEAEGQRDNGRRGSRGRLPNRRVSIDRIREELGWAPRFADFRAGFTEMLH